MHTKHIKTTQRSHHTCLTGEILNATIIIKINSWNYVPQQRFGMKRRRTKLRVITGPVRLYIDQCIWLHVQGKLPFHPPKSFHALKEFLLDTNTADLFFANPPPGKLCISRRCVQ
ncbi:uncharacterized protein [Musca autumnalis]|uniref:uncharacterized protein n=1 Tax=Musca autumnalis TaxID=221902 RepID=UPI003CEED29A